MATFKRQFLLALAVSSAVFLLLLQSSRVDAAAADLSSCPGDIQKLIPCLSYVQGQTNLPSKTCCDNVLPIHLHTPQCLCALILAAINGTSGIPNMNVTLSLGLGHACNIGTQPKTCPGLLGLSPDSREAKIFDSYNPTPSASASPTNSSSSMAATSSNNSSTATSPDNSSASSVCFSTGAAIVVLLSSLIMS